MGKNKRKGTTYEHEILYPSMYMGMEIQRSGDGTVVSGSYTSVNNIYLQGLRIAAMVPTGEVTYYLTDQVDSVRLVADEQGQPVTRTEYYPYGDAWFQEGNTHHAPKFNSQELDRESGLYFYNARYYDADTGRFVTADNVIDGEMDMQGWNRYAYVKGNPVVNKDVDGKQSNPTLQMFWKRTGITTQTEEKISNKIAETAGKSQAIFDGSIGFDTRIVPTKKNKNKINLDREQAFERGYSSYKKIGDGIFILKIVGGVKNLALQSINKSIVNVVSKQAVKKLSNKQKACQYIDGIVKYVLPTPGLLRFDSGREFGSFMTTNYFILPRLSSDDKKNKK